MFLGAECLRGRETLDGEEGDRCCGPVVLYVLLGTVHTLRTEYTLYYCTLAIMVIAAMGVLEGILYCSMYTVRDGRLQVPESTAQ